MFRQHVANYKMLRNIALTETVVTALKSDRYTSPLYKSLHALFVALKLCHRSPCTLNFLLNVVFCSLANMLRPSTNHGSWTSASGVVEWSSLPPPWVSDSMSTSVRRTYMHQYAHTQFDVAVTSTVFILLWLERQRRELKNQW